MKVLGLGLSRTGTATLCDAMTMLGYKAVHWVPERFSDIITGENPKPDFRRFDDCDFVDDIPAAIFYMEIWKSYPDLKFILTLRNVDSWYESVASHYNNLHKFIREKRAFRETRLLQRYAYGSDVPSPFLWKKRFQDHCRQIRHDIPKDRLLEMNVFEGDGWEKLCPFLGVPIPASPFPHSNNKKDPRNRVPAPSLLTRIRRKLFGRTPSIAAGSAELVRSR